MYIYIYIYINIYIYIYMSVCVCRAGFKKRKVIRHFWSWRHNCGKVICYYKSLCAIYSHFTPYT